MTQDYKYIGIHDLQAILGAPFSGQHALLDVRERSEYSAGHITHATPIPRGALEYRIRAQVPNLDAHITLYSSAEERAALAGRTLIGMGYTHVRVLRGGFTAWCAAGNESVHGWNVDGKYIGECLLHDDKGMHISVPHTAEKLRSAKTLVIDIRTAWEHEEGHIPTAVHIPAGELVFYADDIQKRLAAGSLDTVITHCSGRTRGIAAAAFLKTLGVPQSYVLENGGMGWVLAGYDMEQGGTPNYPEIPRAPQPWAEGYAVLPDMPPLMTAATLQKEQQSSPQGRYVLDVRLTASYLSGHIPGSVSIPMGQIMLEFENWLALRGLPVVVVADTAHQAQWVAKALGQAGFPVTALDGGMAAWTEAGFTLEQGLPTEFLQSITHMLDKDIPLVRSSDLVHRDGTPQQGTVFLDVRSTGEWNLMHIPGSISKPRGLLEKMLATLPETDDTAPQACRLNHAQRYVLVSEHGYRAALALRLLSAHPRFAGKVFVLEGGFQAWKEQLPVSLEYSSKSINDLCAKCSRKRWTQLTPENKASMQQYLDWEENLK